MERNKTLFADDVMLCIQNPRTVRTNQQISVKLQDTKSTYESQWWTKGNSECIKDLNVKPDTLTLLEENIGRTFYDINHSKILYDPPPRLIGK